MFRAALLAAPLLLAPISLPAPAGAATMAAQGENCEEQNNRARRRGRGIGGALGGIAGAFGGRLGGAAGVVRSVLPVGELLGEAIAAMLDCDEQQKAAQATEEAVRGGRVGSTTRWESETRPGVTGTSTVTAVEARASDGAECMTVTDVVIVDGEETRAPKRMCRRPPNNRYVRV